MASIYQILKSEKEITMTLLVNGRGFSVKEASKLIFNLLKRGFLIDKGDNTTFIPDISKDMRELMDDEDRAREKAIEERQARKKKAQEEAAAATSDARKEAQEKQDASAPVDDEFLNSFLSGGVKKPKKN